MIVEKILDMVYKIYDRLKLVFYCATYGRRGFYKYLTGKLLNSLRKDAIPYEDYPNYLGFTISLVEICITREVYEQLNEQEKEAIQEGEKIDYVL